MRKILDINDFERLLMAGLLKQCTCESCGAQGDVLIRSNMCWECNDAHNVKEKEKEKEECRRYIEGNVDRILVERGAPPKIVEGLAGIAKIKIPHADGSLYLFGGVGTGKTTLAVAIMKRDALLNLTAEKVVGGRYEVHGVSYRLVRMGDLSRRLRATFNANNGGSVETEHKILDSLCNARKLVVDDFGTEKATEYIANVVYDIIDTRYSNNLTTIFTSNYSPQQIADRYVDKVVGARIASRIVEMCRVVEVGGADRRLEAR
jgi:DNA replication protein DnaC